MSVSVQDGRNTTAVFLCKVANGTNGATEWLINGTSILQLDKEQYAAHSTSISRQFEYSLSVFVTREEEGLTEITCENVCGRATAFLYVDLQSN